MWDQHAWEMRLEEAAALNDVQKKPIHRTKMRFNGRLSEDERRILIEMFGSKARR